MSHSSPRPPRLRAVLFSGGRGSGALTTQLVSNPRVELTIAINGYDDGASTGEVRRFLGDALGPSDFRKNASRLGRALGTAPDALLTLLDARLPDGITGRDAPQVVRDSVTRAALPPELHARVSVWLDRFLRELPASSQGFNFNDCSVGNLVFAGAYLEHNRDFNATVDAYAALHGLPPALIENVTDGTNAFLVAIDADGRLLESEEDIVDAKRRNRIDDIFLLESRLTAADLAQLERLDRVAKGLQLELRAARLRLNPRLAQAVREADLIIYAPGTQHSSLFPSYLTPGLSDAIAANLTAIKLLVTNIQADAEITGSTAVDIIDRAVFYLKEKGRRTIATPCLITHYLMNDPQRAESEAPYVPLGRLESIEDPRLVRVANYEEGFTGRHDATKILGPFIDAFVARAESQQRLAVYLYDADTTTKVVQSVLEMIRGGVRDLPVTVEIFHDGPAPLDASLVRSLGFPVTHLRGTASARDAEFRSRLAHGTFDYVVLFESSGMYNGEDIANLASHLTLGRLDAVWGSRRLSVNDIQESYRLKYQHRAVLGAISYVGSHVLSLLCLGLYGRYISDTLSGARVARASHVVRVPVAFTDKLANQHLLAVLLQRRAEMFEIPVQFFSMSPLQVKRTNPFDGLRAMATLVRGRTRVYEPPQPPAMPRAVSAQSSPGGVEAR